MGLDDVLFEPKFTVHDGLRIRYVASRKPSAESVMLLSPWPESIYAFIRMWPRLSERFSLAAVDLPGFGQSDGRADLMSPRRMGTSSLTSRPSWALASRMPSAPTSAPARCCSRPQRIRERFEASSWGQGRPPSRCTWTARSRRSSEPVRYSSVVTDWVKGGFREAVRR